eukprot:2484658-Lingulodinium_polyedra.AAC.1
MPACCAGSPSRPRAGPHAGTPLLRATPATPWRWPSASGRSGRASGAWARTSRTRTGRGRLP